MIKLKYQTEFLKVGQKDLGNEKRKKNLKYFYEFILL